MGGEERDVTLLQCLTSSQGNQYCSPQPTWQFYQFISIQTRHGRCEGPFCDQFNPARQKIRQNYFTIITNLTMIFIYCNRYLFYIFSLLAILFLKYNYKNDFSRTLRVNNKNFVRDFLIAVSDYQNMSEDIKSHFVVLTNLK